MKLILEVLKKSMEVDPCIISELRSKVKHISENAAVCILWSPSALC